MSEPAWIKHDGSAVCPVPAGKRVEVEWQSGKLGVFENGHNFRWVHIKRYRFSEKEQEAMGKGVPEWALREICKRAMCDYEDVFLQWPSGCSARLAVVEAARLLAAHEQPPVDWLRRVLDEAGNECGLHISEDYVAAIRVRIPNIDSLANAAGEGE